MPSTVIREFRYEPEGGSLFITFTNGRRYRYDGVPEDVVGEMRRAFSKGTFFNRRVRDHFPARRVD